jgi:hypothetical protein
MVQKSTADREAIALLVEIIDGTRSYRLPSQGYRIAVQYLKLC